ncbi:MAG: hypothetical protein GXZ06_07565 [Tissierellia bacterium]|nr:hypothetical protein [Tissierellia bacterium]
MTEEKILKLISLAKEKNKLLDNIIQITKRQEEEIQEERYEDLNKSLKEKDSIINKINKLDRVFLETFHSIKRENSIGDINELSVEEYPALKELKEEVKEIMSNLTALSIIDDRNTEAVKNKLKEAKQDLKRIRLGKKAYKGYNYTEANSILIDEKK